ncbi:MAG: ParA family protein [Anaerolineae bacterium]
MPILYALANQKGGVGKTTTVVNLAAVIADWGFRTLVIDIDPQCNATTSLGLDARSITQTIYDVLVNGLAVDEVIHETKWAGLNLVPSTPSLAGAPVELNAEPARLRVEHLATALASLDDYDYVLIDSPPSLGLLTVNALVAAQGVIIPVQCEYLALEGLTQLMHTISLVQRGLNRGLLLRGVVMTMYDRRTTLSHEVVDEVRRYFPKKVFSTIIPRNVRLSEAPSYGEPGVLYAPRSQGALAYLALSRELLLGDGHDVAWTPEASA